MLPPFYGLQPSDSHADSLGHGLRWADFKSRRFRDIGAKLWAELGHIVREDGRLMAGAGDRDVAKAGVEQVRVDASVGVHQHTLGGESLGTVAGDRVSVVKVAMRMGVEFDLAVTVETG